MKDPAIKLFGQEIAVANIGRDPMFYGENLARDEKYEKEEDEVENDKDPEQDKSPPPMEDDETLYDPEDNPKTPPILEENSNEMTLDAKNDQNNTDSEEKSLKKPDKILPCPRCNSMDTKFCYYNNYNVNQPRHFCKGCQRYWTAGGTTRNVPVGAGRRKNKNPASQYRNITVSDATTQYTNANILSFGSDTLRKGPIFQNKILKVEKENGSDCSSGSSVISSSNSVIPCLQGFPTWPYPAIPNPGFCPPGYPIPVYPIPYWNCGFPLIPTPCGINQNFPDHSPTLPSGKHSRNGELLNPVNVDNKELKEPRTVLIPKTLRIDDPDEAAKSSIWATLGINNEFVKRKGIFKAFERNGEGKNNFVPETPDSMRANPAAMSRSINFQETA